MKTIRRPILLTAALLLAASPWPLPAADAPAAPAAKAPDAQPAPADPKSVPLQGKWEGVEAGRESDGKCTLTITGQTIHLQAANKGEWYQATFTLPADTTPQQLVATITDCPAPAFVGKSAFSIFKLEDGTLTLVGHAPGDPDAPKAFEGDATARKFVFKKVPS